MFSGHMHFIMMLIFSVKLQKHGRNIAVVGQMS
jgi:hypothetical protein